MDNSLVLEIFSVTITLILDKITTCCFAAVGMENAHEISIFFQVEAYLFVYVCILYVCYMVLKYELIIIELELILTFYYFLNILFYICMTYFQET